MRNTICALAVFLFGAAAPAPAAAWGVEAHRYIMGRAIDILPSDLKAFFERHRDEVILRSVDPDLWRSAGWDENANHFLDFGAAPYGAFPFGDLPRDYDRALQKFGRETLVENGLLPWRLAEMFGNLRRAFTGFARNSAYAVSDITLFAPAMSHYIQDAYQPLHATINYDGAQTGQRGIHSRFETELFARMRSKLTVRPAPPRLIASPRDFAFDTLVESHQLAATLLAADKRATNGRELYDDGYFEALFAGTRALLEQQVGNAITATASLIMSAWHEAGRPVLQPPARPPQRIRSQQE